VLVVAKWNWTSQYLLDTIIGSVHRYSHVSTLDPPRHRCSERLNFIGQHGSDFQMTSLNKMSDSSTKPKNFLPCGYTPVMDL